MGSPPDDQLLKTHSRDVCEGVMTGAQYEIRIDGTPRTYRDRREPRDGGRASLLKSKNPHSVVEVKDLKSGDVTAVALRPA